MTTQSAARLSGARMNALHDRLLAMALAKKKYLFEEVYRSGYPPGAAPIPAFDQYQNLLELRANNDPRFLENSKAQSALARLENRFGQAPPFVNPQQVGQQMAESTPVLAPGGEPVAVPRLLSMMEARHSLSAAIRSTD